MSDVCHGMSYNYCKQDTGAGGSGITAVDSLQILHTIFDSEPQYPQTVFRSSGVT